jgi:hypothetical protein
VPSNAGSGQAFEVAGSVVDRDLGLVDVTDASSLRTRTSSTTALQSATFVGLTRELYRRTSCDEFRAARSSDS